MLKRIYPIVIAAITLLGVGVRTWELYYAVEKTGFYLPQYETLCNILGVVAVGVLVVAIVIGRFSLLPQTPVVLPKKNLLLGGAALLLTVASVFQGVWDYNGASTPTMSLIGFIACMLCAVGFGVIGLSLLLGKTIPFGAAVLPVISHLGYLVLQYANFNGISRMSENIIYILFICSFLALTLSQCRLISGVDSQKGVAFGYGAAAATAFFGFCSCLPHWVLGFVGKEQPSVSLLLGFGAGVYALVLLFTLPSLNPQETAE